MGTNRQHLRIILDGPESYNQWRAANPEQQLVLDGATIKGLDFTDYKLSRVQAQGATFSKVIFKEMKHCNLNGATFEDCDFKGSTLSSVSFGQAKLRRTHFDDATLVSVTMDSAKFWDSSLRGVDLSGMPMNRIRLDNTDLAGSNWYEADVSESDWENVKNAHKAKNLHHTIIQIGGGRAKNFDRCQLGFMQEWLGWGNIRGFGKLPFFSFSYSFLFIMPVVFMGIHFYNGKVALAKEWAGRVQESNLASTTTPNSDVQPIIAAADTIWTGLPTIMPPSIWFWLFFASVLLALASTVYLVACPSVVKEFSRHQWCFQNNRPLLHYWPLAWRYPVWRIISFTCYSVGGLIVLYVLADRCWYVIRIACVYEVWPFA